MDFEIETNYYIDGCVYVRFNLNDGKTGEAYLQLPNSQTSRHDIEIDGTEIEDGELHQQIFNGLLAEIRDLYPDKVKRSLLYTGCDVDNIANLNESWQDGWRRCTVELKDGSIERYREVPGDVSDDIYFVKEE